MPPRRQANRLDKRPVRILGDREHLEPVVGRLCRIRGGDRVPPDEGPCRDADELEQLDQRAEAAAFDRDVEPCCMLCEGSPRRLVHPRLYPPSGARPTR